MYVLREVIFFFLNALLLKGCGLPFRQLCIWIWSHEHGSCEHIHGTGVPLGGVKRKEAEGDPGNTEGT